MPEHLLDLPGPFANHPIYQFREREREQENNYNLPEGFDYEYDENEENSFSRSSRLGNYSNDSSYRGQNYPNNRRSTDIRDRNLEQIDEDNEMLN